MADNTSPNEQMLVASMDIQQDANKYKQKINKITQPFISDLLFQRTLGLPDQTQLKQHNNTLASLDV